MTSKPGGIGSTSPLLGRRMRTLPTTASPEASARILKPRLCESGVVTSSSVIPKALAAIAGPAHLKCNDCSLSRCALNSTRFGPRHTQSGSTTYSRYELPTCGSPNRCPLNRTSNPFACGTPAVCSCSVITGCNPILRAASMSSPTSTISSVDVSLHSTNGESGVSMGVRKKFLASPTLVFGLAAPDSPLTLTK